MLQVAVREQEVVGMAMCQGILKQHYVVLGVKLVE